MEEKIKRKVEFRRWQWYWCRDLIFVAIFRNGKEKICWSHFHTYRWHSNRWPISKYARMWCWWPIFYVEDMTYLCLLIHLGNEFNLQIVIVLYYRIVLYYSIILSWLSEDFKRSLNNAWVLMSVINIIMSPNSSAGD